MEEVLEYYESYDEDSRLTKDNAHKIEFIATTHFLDQYIQKPSKVLEVGAGTGIYSLYYAEKGCDVTAIDLTPKHVAMMREKAQKQGIIMEAKVGNALDLSELNENTYNTVLCLGPIYHLPKEADREKCIYECMRVLKPGGILAVAYINKFASFISMVCREKEKVKDKELHSMIKNVTKQQEGISSFHFSCSSEIEELMSSFAVEKLHHIGTDGIGATVRGIVNPMDEEEFKKWMDYHFATCEESSIIGYSQHGLYIGRKI